jgi:hypothetical protein
MSSKTVTNSLPLIGPDPRGELEEVNSISSSFDDSRSMKLLKVGMSYILLY